MQSMYIIQKLSHGYSVVETHKNFLMRGHNPGKDKTTRVLARVRSRGCLPPILKGSRVTETACVPTGVGPQRCYQEW